MNGKGTVAIASALLAAIAGLYLSGWVTLKLLGLESAPLQWNTWWAYFTALDLPQFAPYATRIKLAGAAGFGLPTIGWLLLLIALFKSREEAFHGNARFAAKSDLRKAGLLTHSAEEGILLGKYKGRHIWLNGALHVMVVAPTRSGKSTSIAIPVLLSYESSAIVLDVKGELFGLTSGYRFRHLGQHIYVWSPYDESGRTHRFNPFTALMRVDTNSRLSELQTIAAILYPDEPGKDPFWTSQARAAFVGFAAYMFENWDDIRRQNYPGAKGDAPDPHSDPRFPSLERIYRMTSGGGRQGGVRQLIEDALSAANRKDHAHLSQQTCTAFSSLAGLPEETFSSVIASVQAPLQQFLSPILAAATNATDFDVMDVRRQKMTIYVVIPPQKLDESSKLLNIFFSCAIGGNLKVDKRADPALKHQVLMLMDEFTAMGRLDVWAKRISVSAGYGVRALTIVQSRSQLRAVYGPDDAQNFITNHAANIVFTPREQEDADAYSLALGDRIVRRKHRSVSRGAGAGSVSYSTTEERRPLMLPQEVKELPKDDELVFVEGCLPIRGKKAWYFKDKLFNRRLLPAVTIPTFAAQHSQDTGP